MYNLNYEKKTQAKRTKIKDAREKKQVIQVYFGLLQNKLTQYNHKSHFKMNVKVNGKRF